MLPPGTWNPGAQILPGTVTTPVCPCCLPLRPAGCSPLTTSAHRCSAQVGVGGGGVGAGEVRPGISPSLVPTTPNHAGLRGSRGWKGGHWVRVGRGLGHQAEMGGSWMGMGGLAENLVQEGRELVGGRPECEQRL